MAFRKYGIPNSESEGIPAQHRPSRWDLRSFLRYTKRCRTVIDSVKSDIKMQSNIFVVFVTLILSCVAAKHPQYQHLPPLREQAKIQDGWRVERLDSVPALLQKHGVDAWLVGPPVSFDLLRDSVHGSYCRA